MQDDDVQPTAEPSNITSLLSKMRKPSRFGRESTRKLKGYQLC